MSPTVLVLVLVLVFFPLVFRAASRREEGIRSHSYRDGSSYSDDGTVATKKGAAEARVKRTGAE